MQNQPFPVDPVLTAISIAYRNPDQHLINEQVLPPVPPIGGDTYKYFEFPLAQGFSVPNLLVGRRGQPTEIEFSAVEKDGSTKDYGLDSPVPYDDIEKARNAGGKIDPVKLAVETTTDLIILGREVRVANQVFSAANYPAANKVALVGGAKFSDYANSDPVGVIEEYLDKPIAARPNIATMGQAVWSKLRVHPKIVGHCLGTASTVGFVSKERFAEAFELDEVIVGKARINTARRGQVAALGYIWGPHISLTYRDRSATNGNGKVTFGLQIPRGTRQAGQEPDKNIGMRGGQRARVWESQNEHVICPDAGALIQDAV